jgi:Aspartyl/Asparaginyl beta-hydroxylase/L-proline 3-hydroxylase, C-terminal
VTQTLRPTGLSSTRRLGAVELDLELLAYLEPSGFVETRDRFVCGSQLTCVLEADSIPPLFDDLDVRSARLVKLGPGCVVVPRREPREHGKGLTQVEIPLETTPACLASEGSTVFRMRPGELWALDASQPHGAANLSHGERTHLVLDVAGDLDGSSSESIPEDAEVERRPLRPGEWEAFAELAEIVDAHNLRDVLAMLVKRFFVAEMEVEEIFRWLAVIASDSDNEDVLAQSRWLEQRSLVVW